MLIVAPSNCLLDAFDQPASGLRMPCGCRFFGKVGILEIHSTSRSWLAANFKFTLPSSQV